MFGNAEIRRLATEEFIAVAADDWYQRRREDAEGRFFRRVADQGPRKGEGGSTRQGIYALTADGILLGYKNPADAGVLRDTLQQALREWRRLPEERRRPGAVKVEEMGESDPRFSRRLPAGGIIVDVHARILDHQQEGFCAGTCQFPGGARASHDHLWLTREEVESLMPPQPKIGNHYPLPAQLTDRIARFHLVDNTRGEPNFWKKEQVRSQDFSLTVEAVEGTHIRLRLDGSALLATRPDVQQAERGYDVRLLGTIGYDAATRKLDRFEVVALGDHWGEGTYTRKARPGRQPFGIVFDLASTKAPGSEVPPQGAREFEDYFGPTRK